MYQWCMVQQDTQPDAENADLAPCFQTCCNRTPQCLCDDMEGTMAFIERHPELLGPCEQALAQEWLRVNHPMSLHEPMERLGAVWGSRPPLIMNE